MMAFLDATSLELAGNTLALVALTLLGALPLGTFLALLIFRCDVPGRKVWLALLGLQLFVPLFVHAAAWDAGFGVLGWFTTAIGGEIVPLHGLRGAVWIHTVAALPWVVLIVGIGSRLVEPELEEDALLYAPPHRVLWHVTLRRALPAVGIAGIWVALTTAGEMTATDLFRIRTYAEEIYTTLAGTDDALSSLLPIGPLLVTVIALVMAAVPLCAAMAPPPRPAETRPLWTFELGRWRTPLGVLAGGLIVALTLIPLLSLCYKAGVGVEWNGSDPVRAWSLGKFADMVFFSPARFAEELGWSAQLAALTVVGSITLGALLAWAARRGGVRSSTILSGTAALLAIPGPLIGLVLIWLLNRREIDAFVWLYDRTLFAPWLALVARTLPWATLVLWFALRSVPAESLESAAVDGAGPLARLIYIGLPQRLGALALAALVTFAVALGDLAATVLVLPPGVETLSVRIFRFIHAAADDQVAGICLMLLLLLAVICAAMAFAFRQTALAASTRRR
jgi:iron(III) transport system permease protein